MDVPTTPDPERAKAHTAVEGKTKSRGPTTISAISIGVAWLLVVENILAATVKHSARWMPGSMANVVATGGDINVSYVHALWVLTAYLAVGVLVSGFLFRRRDVTN